MHGTRSHHSPLHVTWSAANVALILVLTLLFLIFLLLFLNMTALPAQAQGSAPPTAIMPRAIWGPGTEWRPTVG
jgi:hypothetical protein